MGISQAECKCLLVVAPNSRLYEPHLGVSLLKAGLLRNGYPAEVYYASAHLVETFGLCVQQLLSIDCMLDAVCSALVVPRPEAAFIQFARDLHRAGVLPDLRPGGGQHETLLGLIRIFRSFRELVVDRIIASGAQIVGFSSTFWDRLFCADTICEIKKRAPHIRTIMGGPNCDGEMGEELFALFPQIDYICQGYADRSLIDIVKSLNNHGKLLGPMPGVLSREQPGPVREPAAALTTEEYEALPDPDFHEFFAQIDQAFRKRGLLRRRGAQVYPAGVSSRLWPGMPWIWARNLFPSLAMETCRGCWWARGSRDRRCAFCGDMQAIQPHLQKRSDVALAQVRRIAKEYKAASVYLTDRLASTALAAGFWDRIAADSTAPLFSTEATGSTSREMVQLLAEAGAHIVQIGIESLDASDLRAMGKPTTVIRNVATLKHFADFGMWPSWGYLGPTPASYTSNPDHAAKVIDSLTHLAPPFPPSLKRIDIYRFSKYFESPESFGLGRLEVWPMMRRIYPLPKHSLQRLSHQFLPETAPLADMSAVRHALALWTRVHWRSHLLYVAKSPGGWIVDTRTCRTSVLHRLGAAQAAVYEFCRVPRTVSSISSSLCLEENTVTRLLAAFVGDRTILQQDSHYLSLAVQPSSAYRRFRQAVGADLSSRTPLGEVLLLAACLQFGWRGTAISMGSALSAKARSLLLTFRWRLSCSTVRLAAALLRHV